MEVWGAHLLEWLVSTIGTMGNMLMSTMSFRAWRNEHQGTENCGGVLAFQGCCMDTSCQNAWAC
jgi:hypothetical protein